MIEIGEARTIAKQLRKEIVGKTVVQVGGNFTDHKFTWYYGDPNKYSDLLVGKKITNIIDRNFYVEIEIEDYILFMRDGANVRIYDNRCDFPEKSKLLLEFDDGSFINITVQMLACIGLYKKGSKDLNKYYQLELEGISPLDKEFSLDYFKKMVASVKPSMSAKGLIATEQRIIGIGNGTALEILYNAKINPRTKIANLDDNKISDLYEIIVNTVKEILEQGGRDTEKDIYGNKGKYKTHASKLAYKSPCQKCNSTIIKENFLGGSIYYCPKCQPK